MEEGIVKAAVIGVIWSATMTLFIDSKIRSALLHIFLGLWKLYIPLLCRSFENVLLFFCKYSETCIKRTPSGNAVVSA